MWTQYAQIAAISAIIGLVVVLVWTVIAQAAVMFLLRGKNK